MRHVCIYMECPVRGKTFTLGKLTVEKGGSGGLDFSKGSPYRLRYLRKHG